MKIHCIRHEPFEGLASIESWTRRNNHQLSCTHTYLNQRFPDDTAFDMLIILGGTASVYEPDKYTWLAAEKKFIQKVINSRKKVFGICLGAQILADMHGAAVYPCRSKETGWFKVTFNRTELPAYSFLPDQLLVFHWHGDTFDIPHTGIRFASSELTPNQGFILGQNILALQFHLEMDLISLKKIIKGAGNQLHAKDEFIQQADQILALAHYIEANNELVFRILDQFTSDTSR
jgi:GMP synthase-like glutamine amidotransferase